MHTDDIGRQDPESSAHITIDPKAAAAPGDTGNRSSMPRQTTFGSEINVCIEDKLRRDEDQIEDNIRVCVPGVPSRFFKPSLQLPLEAIEHVTKSVTPRTCFEVGFYP